MPIVQRADRRFVARDDALQQLDVGGGVFLTLHVSTRPVSAARQ